MSNNDQEPKFFSQGPDEVAIRENFKAVGTVEEHVKHDMEWLLKHQQLYVEQVAEEQSQWRDLIKLFGGRAVTLLVTFNGGGIVVLLTMISRLVSPEMTWGSLSAAFY